jgi:hypothetical protein
MRSGLLLAYQAIRTCLRERNIGERNIGERDIGETVATCRFTQQLLIHIHI